MGGNEKTLHFEIDGGHALSGKVKTNTSKNGAVALLMASLLNKGKTVLKRVPKIEEVHRIIEVLDSIGVSVSWDKDTLTIIPPKKISFDSLDIIAAQKTRSVLMIVGPLLHEFSSFSIPQAGGCKLGSRTIRPHIYALEKFGVEIRTTENSYDIKRSILKATEIIMYESGDTATLNAVFAAARIPGETTIKYASANYQVQEICCFLKKLGIEIEGNGTTTLKIKGVKEINKDVKYTLSEDPTDSMFFIASSIVTKSSIIITNCPIAFLELELLTLEKMGFKYEILKRYQSESRCIELVDIKTYPSELKAPEDKIHARPYPGLNVDNLPFFAVIATQAKGQTMIHDWVYEKRAIYYTELDKIGAETVLADPHRIFITGPTKLRPAELICPPALRPATIILIGMLGANGHSVLRNVYSINRGYADLADRLNSIGGNIKILET